MLTRMYTTQVLIYTCNYDCRYPVMLERGYCLGEVSEQKADYALRVTLPCTVP